jgi:hypothetical protein
MAEKPQVEGLKAASDTTKQLITLSTGVVTITVTFFDKFGTSGEDGARIIPGTLLAAWGLFGLALLCGLWTLAAVTGSLNLIDRKANGQTLDAGEEAKVSQLAMAANVRWPAFLMMIAFLSAMGCTIWSGLSLR